MKGNFDAYVTVTFGQNGPKLNSRPVYCLRLYGIETVKLAKLAIFPISCLVTFFVLTLQKL